MQVREALSCRGWRGWRRTEGDRDDGSQERWRGEWWWWLVWRWRWRRLGLMIGGVVNQSNRQYIPHDGHMNVSSYIQSPNPSSLLVVHLIPLCFLNCPSTSISCCSFDRAVGQAIYLLCFLWWWSILNCVEVLVWTLIMSWYVLWRRVFCTAYLQNHQLLFSQSFLNKI